MNEKENNYLENEWVNEQILFYRLNDDSAIETLIVNKINYIWLATVITLNNCLPKMKVTVGHSLSICMALHALILREINVILLFCFVDANCSLTN